MDREVKEKILAAFRFAKNTEDKPWILQDKLREIFDSVVAVGDDLSFTIKLEKTVKIDEEKILSLGAKKTKIYPFKNAYRFEKGFVAVEGRFLRISRELDEDVLLKVLEALG